MRQKLIYGMVVCLLLCACVRAQEATFKIWNGWCAAHDTLLLFPTGNNLLQVVVPSGIKADDIILKSMDNALKIGVPDIKGDTLTVMAMPYPKYGKRLRLAITDKNTHKTLATYTFYAGTAPEPAAQVSNTDSDHISKATLAAKPYIRVVFPGSLYAYPYQVKQFTFNTRFAGRDTAIAWKGAAIGAALQQIIKDLPTGSFIEFTNIKAACANCTERELQPVKVWVK